MTRMEPIDLHTLAATLPAAWRSVVVADPGRARIKVLRMDGTPHPNETHMHDEALLVIDGRLELTLAGEPCTAQAGEMVLVKAGTPHAVRTGSSGVLLIIEA